MFIIHGEFLHFKKAVRPGADAQDHAALREERIYNRCISGRKYEAIGTFSHHQISQKHRRSDLFSLYFSFIDEINEGYFTFAANCVQIKSQKDTGLFLPGGTARC